MCLRGGVSQKVKQQSFAADLDCPYLNEQIPFFLPPLLSYSKPAEDINTNSMWQAAPRSDQFTCSTLLLVFNWNSL